LAAHRAFPHYRYFISPGCPGLFLWGLDYYCDGEFIVPAFPQYPIDPQAARAYPSPIRVLVLSW